MFAREDPDACDRAQFAVLARENPLPYYRLQPWPLPMSASSVRSLEATSLGLVRLIATLPRRFFDNDPDRLHAFYGIRGAWWMALATAEPDGIAAALYRPDFIETARGFQCVEVNGGNPGGWLISALAPLYPRVPVIARGLQRAGVELRWRNTARLLFAHFIHQVRGLSDGADDGLIVAVTVDRAAPRDFPPAARELCRTELRAAVRDAWPGVDGDVVFVTWEELECGGGRLCHRGRTISALVTEAPGGDGESERQAFRCFKAGHLHLAKPPATLILSDKRNLALLSAGMSRGPFSDAERRLIAASIPWTRCVIDGVVDFDRATVDLRDLLANHRAGLVLKRATSHGGEDVYLGPILSDAHWTDAVRTAFDGGDWVVQEYLEPRPHLLLGPAGDPVAHHIVLGVFVVGDCPAGGLLRVLRADGYTPQSTAKTLAAHAMRALDNGDEQAEVMPLFEAVAIER
jgi:hypothetical protein